MSDKYHYDKNGNYIGKSSSIPPEIFSAGSVFFIAIIIFLEFIWKSINNYQMLSYPYKAVAFFYYVLLVLPINAIKYIHVIVSTNSLLPYSNLNLVLALFCDLMFIALLILIMRFIAKLPKVGWGKLILSLFAPLLFILVWFILAQVFKWLFS